jgi:hypothetical protein
MGDFHGEPTRVLENQFVELEYLANSARIIRFAPKGKTNLFADLGRTPVETQYGKRSTKSNTASASISRQNPGHIFRSRSRSD